MSTQHTSTQHRRRYRLVAAAATALGVGAAVVGGAAPASAITSMAQTNTIVGTNLNGDGRSDVALTGASGWNTLPVALSQGDGTFSVTNQFVGQFAAWAATPGVKVISGDFNGDGRSDVALTGVSGWNTLPIAFANGDGSYTVTNDPVGQFAAWAATPGVTVVTGDFNGDGRTDVALTGPAGWNTLPVAFSRGSGAFAVTNRFVGQFATWANTPGVHVVTGDFNGDRRTDVALAGPAGWNTLPVAFSRGSGAFAVTNRFVGQFATWANTPGVHVVAGDFDGDGRTDVALTGPAGWNTLPVAFSRGGGFFAVTNRFVGAFAAWAASPGVRVLAGDFNGDRRMDVALTGVNGWATLPVAYSRGSGFFSVANQGVGSFATWASTPGVTVITGDFNGDGRSDVALTGVNGWATLPVAFTRSDGTYSVTNDPVGQFAGWASTPGATVVTTPATAPR